MQRGVVKNSGSVLLYVLWILVVISLLAFKLSSASRVVMLKQVSDVSQIKKGLQLNSAIQFATFKILSDDWENKKFEQNLNNQEISIEIYNESGFISLYDLSSQSLKNVIETSNITSDVMDELALQFDEKKLRFNDFMELTQFEGISEEDVRKIIPYISIYHQEGVNPSQSPADVLLKLEGVDKYRVNKMKESTDSDEIMALRRELVDLLSTGNAKVSESVNNYYRIHISLESRLYLVFLKFSGRSREFVVVNTVSL
jgi:hypothetical protein